jgi:sugar/nucleoside kinase (ribokinase family)
MAVTAASVSPASAPVICAGVVVVDHLCPPIDHLPRPGELVPCDDLVLNIGGGAANTAMALTRLGIEAAIGARVGDDFFGRFARESLQQGGVDVAGLQVDPERSTSQSLIVNVRGEDRRFIHHAGANRAFTAADLDPLLDRKPRVLHIAYFLLLEHLRGPELAERFQRAREQGTFTLLDVAAPGPGEYLEGLHSVLPHTDLFVPNRDEAELILGEADPVRQALAFRALGARRVIITMGDRGTIAVSDELAAHLGIFPITYVDGTGGGDAFNAGYIAGVLEGLDELGRLKLASAIGASCVRAVGTTAGVFTRDEATAFLAQHDLPTTLLASTEEERD